LTYEKWANRVYKFREIINKVLKDKYIVGYGAAAKGNTLLNFINIKPEFIIDDNELKQNLYSPGQNSLIVPSSYIKNLPEISVTFIPLAWNLFDEIKNNILKIRNNPKDEFINLKEIFIS
jgi:hypothetical protein